MSTQWIIATTNNYTVIDFADLQETEEVESNENNFLSFIISYLVNSVYL